MKGRTSLASKASSSKDPPKRERFASKYVQRIINDDIVENPKNQITDSIQYNIADLLTLPYIISFGMYLKKFAEKMKSNVLQKVSLGSTIVFMPSDNAVSQYDQEIVQVEKKIALQIGIITYWQQTLLLVESQFIWITTSISLSS